MSAPNWTAQDMQFLVRGGIQSFDIAAIQEYKEAAQRDAVKAFHAAERKRRRERAVVAWSCIALLAVFWSLVGWTMHEWFNGF